jgi:tRNA nucleotidyltransferase (CCA-adding enzyme)
MAYSPSRGLVDFFGGISDINSQTLRCVGDPDKRFREDALRIIRALRFASVLGFSIENETSTAIFRNGKLLGNIAAQRIASELNKMIAGVHAKEVLLSYTPIIKELIPEVAGIIGFEQVTPHHHPDVWGHTVESVVSVPADIALRLTMLLHDIAKPNCYTEMDSVGHFHGHPQTGSDMAKKILSRLKYDNNTIETVTQLVLYHDADIQPERKHIKRWLNRIGEERLRQLLVIKRADVLARAEKYHKEKIAALDEVELVLNEVMKQQQCFSLKDMAVTGRDLMAVGVPEGIMVGSILNQLLELVIDEEAENEKAHLIKIASELFSAMDESG